jgi:hypothetical protein
MSGGTLISAAPQTSETIATTVGVLTSAIAKQLRDDLPRAKLNIAGLCCDDPGSFGSC